jgi:hypothetical protein
MTFTRELVHDAHIHRLVVSTDATGWNVREEEDATVIRQSHHDDWHRVERAVQLFEHAAMALEEDGWVERRQHP